MRSGGLMRVVVQLPTQLPKAGIIVSKKLSRKATERNRLKRRLRAGLVRVLPGFSDLYAVVLPTKRALSVSVAGLEEELRFLLQS